MSTSSEYFTDREISSLHRENTGTPYNRINYVKDIAFQARVDAALKVEEVCGVVRKSWTEAEEDGPACRLPKGHEGTHTVFVLAPNKK